jgi:hypothetical protein
LRRQRRAHDKAGILQIHVLCFLATAAVPNSPKASSASRQALYAAMKISSPE